MFWKHVLGVRGGLGRAVSPARRCVYGRLLVFLKVNRNEAATLHKKFPILAGREVKKEKKQQSEGE